MSRGLGVTAAQQAANDAITKAAMAYNFAQIADAQAGLTSASPATLAAQQNLQIVANQSVATTATGGVSEPSATAYIPYVLAGALGVAVLGAIIYFATE